METPVLTAVSKKQKKGRIKLRPYLKKIFINLYNLLKMKRPIISFQTVYGTEEYIVHAIFPKMEIFQLYGPYNVRTWQEQHAIFKEKVGFFKRVKLSLQIAYLKMWDKF